MISQEALLQKIKKEVTQAEKYMHTNQFSVHIGKLHVLSEVLLDESTVHDSKTSDIQVSKRQVQQHEEHKPHTQDEDAELLEGDSIFDF